LVVQKVGHYPFIGTLKDFKRGPFKMAMDAGVDIVPIALCDLYRWHPPSALMPLKR
jgi:1-acyl-sn-glycerol-3-phosphate acyltransferase